MMIFNALVCLILLSERQQITITIISFLFSEQISALALQNIFM